MRNEGWIAAAVLLLATTTIGCRANVTLDAKTQTTDDDLLVEIHTLPNSDVVVKNAASGIDKKGKADDKGVYSLKMSLSLFKARSQTFHVESHYKSLFKKGDATKEVSVTLPEPIRIHLVGCAPNGGSGAVWVDSATWGTIRHCPVSPKGEITLKLKGPAQAAVTIDKVALTLPANGQGTITLPLQAWLLDIPLEGVAIPMKTKKDDKPPAVIKASEAKLADLVYPGQMKIRKKELSDKISIKISSPNAMAALAKQMVRGVGQGHGFPKAKQSSGVIYLSVYPSKLYYTGEPKTLGETAFIALGERAGMKVSGKCGPYNGSKLQNGHLKIDEKVNVYSQDGRNRTAKTFDGGKKPCPKVMFGKGGRVPDFADWPEEHIKGVWLSTIK
jgi:hypothetical protein